MLVHPYQRLLRRIDLAANHGEMDFATRLVGICAQFEWAVRTNDFALGDTFHQFFVLVAIVDQVANGADLELVFTGEHQQIRQPRHGAVFLEYFANHGGRLFARQPGQITAGFGVPCTDQNATVLRHQRKDVARLNNVRSLCILCYRRLYRAGPVMGGNSAGHTLGRFDGNGERGAVGRFIVAHHL